MLNAEGKSTTALHTRFDDKETDAMGLLQVGKFAARTMLSKRDVVGAIHAIDYPANARFVRVTGTDLEDVPRLKFDVEKGEAVVIESATVGRD